MSVISATREAKVGGLLGGPALDKNAVPYLRNNQSKKAESVT
jgi:hypothetical protein